MKRLAFLLAVLLLGAVTAHAQPWPGTLLFEGGEVPDFKCVGGWGGFSGCLWSTNPALYRSGWSRGAVSDGQPDTNTPPRSYLTLPADFAPQTTLWVHGWYCGVHVISCPTDTNSPSIMLGIFNNLGNLAVQVTGSGGGDSVDVFNNTHSFAGPCVGIPDSKLQQIDLAFVLSATVGEMHLYANGVDICDYTGDTTLGDGATGLTNILLGAARGGTGSGWWSEVLVGTADTTKLARKSAYPVADGIAVEWNPGAGGCSTLARTPGNSQGNLEALIDPTYIYTDSTASRTLCSLNTSIPPGSYEGVVALGLAARAQSPSATPTQFSWLTRIVPGPPNPPVIYTLTPAQTPTTGVFNNGNMLIQTTNPNTGLAWQLPNFGAGFQVGPKSQ